MPLVRVILVQPLWSFDIGQPQEDSCGPCDSCECSESQSPSEGGCEEGKFKMNAPKARAVGANGAILTALAGLLQKAAAELPTILPEILQLIALFGGTVTPTPTPAPSSTPAA